MLKHFAKMAARVMLREKGYSLINIISLALGLAASILILVYVRYEFSFDQYHDKKDRLYRLVTSVDDASYTGIAKVTGPWGLAAKQEIPEVEEVTRLVRVGQLLMSHDEQRDYETGGLYADPAVFEMFSFVMLAGDPATALAEPNSIVLTRDLASKYFDQENPLGRQLTQDDGAPLQVTGVIENVALNSHFTFDFLLSMATLEHPDKDNWIRWNQFYTYVLLRAGADPTAFGVKMKDIVARNLGERGQAYHPYLQPVTSIHLHSNLFRELAPNSDINYLYMMSAAALFLLVIGCVNFINISTARASKRAKEVGVRKVAGADRLLLAQQFLSESLLMSMLGLVVAVALVELALPGFNQLTARQIAIDWATDHGLLFGLGLLTLITGLLAGGYPALVLSSFHPAKILKNDRHALRGAGLRKLLVILQFSLSAFLIIATAVVFDQVEYIQQKKLGFNKEQLMVIPIRDLAAQSETIKTTLLQNPGIVSVSATANRPGGSDYGIPYQPIGVPEDQIPPARIFVGDQDMIPVLEIEMVAGRPFSRDVPSDATSAFIINEEAARQLGWQNPLNERIAMPAIGRAPAPVIGVVKDFHFRSMHEKIAPAVFFVPPPEWLSTFLVRIRPDRMQATIDFLEKKFAEFDPSHPFSYRFFDQQFAALHTAEKRVATLLTVTSTIAIGIACLGLLGLAAFSAQVRTKEIGVRKVLGASITGIVTLLTKDFLKLVLLANLIACPLAYFAIQRWLANFAYRTEINPAAFLVTMMLAVIIAVLTVSFQAIRAATANPVDALRYE